jgi:hypothetical protein
LQDSGKAVILYNTDESYGNNVQVRLEDVVGDIDDLIGSPLLKAEYVSEKGENDETSWTFYKFSTVKGSVTLRWVGNDDGYYSTTVDVEFCDKEEAKAIFEELKGECLTTTFPIHEGDNDRTVPQVSFCNKINKWKLLYTTSSSAKNDCRAFKTERYFDTKKELLEAMGLKCRYEGRWVCTKEKPNRPV